VNKNLFGAFGEVGTFAGTTFGFTGQRYDSDLGLHYYKRRVYSQNLGRFLQTDPIGYTSDLNLYTYVSNNPLNLTDPMGLWGDWGGGVGPGENGGFGYGWGNQQWSGGNQWGNGYGYGNHHVGYDGGATYIDPVTGDVRDSSTGEILIPNSPGGNGHGASTIPGGSASGPPQYTDGNSPGYNISGPGNFGTGVTYYGPGGRTTIVASSVQNDINSILNGRPPVVDPSYPPRFLPIPESGGGYGYPRVNGPDKSPDGLGDFPPLPPGYDKRWDGPPNYPPPQKPPVRPAMPRLPFAVPPGYSRIV